MTSAARQKVDPFTRQMFDPEVDKPKHDEILTTLFNDRQTLGRLLTEFHCLRPLRQPEEIDSFRMNTRTSGNDAARISRAEALAKCGGEPPALDHPSPLRLVKKQLECLMNYQPEENRASRLMGFVDIGIVYDVVEEPHVVRELDLRNQYVHNWSVRKTRYAALIEVKAEWPTAGNLIRQLNLYRACWPQLPAANVRGMFLVGPDDSMNALANEHGYRLITFSPGAKEFKLEPRVWFPPDGEKPEPF